jgi:hypothetical protein
MSPEIPDLLQRIFKLVERVRGEIAGGNITPGRQIQSYKYWGFRFCMNNKSFWFGYMLPHWGKYETPLFLQTRPSWDGNGTITDEALARAGFEKGLADDFILPIRLDAGDETAALGAIVARLQQAVDGLTADQPVARPHAGQGPGEQVTDAPSGGE